MQDVSRPPDDGLLVGYPFEVSITNNLAVVGYWESLKSQLNMRQNDKYCPNGCKICLAIIMLCCLLLQCCKVIWIFKEPCRFWLFHYLRIREPTISFDSLKETRIKEPSTLIISKKKALRIDGFHERTDK